jgi:hypothetical protein
MDKYINKNSLAAVISSFTESVEKWVISPDEALATKPSNFINMLSSTLGKLNAYGYYDMLASKNEVNQSTAIRMKSLLRHLRSDMINDIYGTPASIVFILSFPEKLLIKHAAPYSYGISKLTLNKNAKILIPNKPQFTLDNNINIFVNKYDANNETKYSIYATFDTTSLDNGSLFKIINPFINSRNDVYIDGQRYFTMYIPVKQYERDSVIYELSGENKDISYTYQNQLVGFTVLYKEPSDVNWRIINTYLEGSANNDGLSYSLTDVNSVKILTLKYSKVPGGFSPINGTLKLNVFTTLGKDGNFSIPKESLDTDEGLSGLSMTMEQDTSDLYQEALITLIPTGSLYTLNAEGGKNALSLEEVRRLVINRAMSLIITPSGLSQAASEYDFSDSKMRHDLLEWRYKLSKYLQDDKQNIVPSRSIDISFLYSEIENFVDSNSRVIAPYDQFKYDEEKKEYVFTPLNRQDTYVDYLTKYKSGRGNDYLFPYFLRIQNGQHITVEPYDLSINEIRTTEFVYISENILDKTSIMHAEFIRNPLDTEKVIVRGHRNILGNFYSIDFSVYTSSAIIDHLKSLGEDELPYIKFKIIIKNKSDGVRYALDIDPAHYGFDTRDNSIQCTGYIETNNSILKNGKICMVNNSLTKIPFSIASYPFYFIDGEVDTEIVVLCRELNGVNNSSEYDMYLTSVEVMNNYYIGIIYKIDNVVLAKNMSKHVFINPDIKLTQPVYRVADKDIPDIYNEIVYKMDNGHYVTEKESIKLADGNYQTIERYVILHNIGDIKKELDGRIGTFDITTVNNSIWSNEESGEGIYNIGDILGGNPIYASVKTNNGLIIFGGKDGRIGCYDVTKNIMYPYNTEEVYRDGGEMLIIKSDGAPLAHKDIRTMLVIQVIDTYHSNQLVDILIIAGENGLVASLNLSTGVWCYCDGSHGDALANIYNNGSGMGASNIYCSTLYENQANPNKNTLIFAGGDGRMCCYNIHSRIWYNYDSTYSEHGVITNDGRAMGYKAILTMVNYLNSILFLAGTLGHIATCELATQQFTHFDAGTGIHSAGEIIGGVSIYASSIINAIYVVAGEHGRVASYDIAKSIWTSYEQHGFASNGSIVNNKNINAMEPYDNYMIFGSDDGLVASYNIFTNEWTPYNAVNGIRNNGNFIKNSISTIIKYNTIIYFTGKAGNVIYKYRKGDILLDENNQLIVEKPSELQGVIKSLPAYNRIYGIKSSFFSILKSYNDMIVDIASLTSRYPKGCILCLGIKNTSGPSSTFKFVNTKTKTEEYLDSLGISLSLGVKFKDNVFDDDKSYLVNEILEEIISYVKNIQSTNGEAYVTLNFITMLDTIRDNVPNIAYFELYTINNYDAHICQTIFWKKEIEDIYNISQNIFEEYLSIKNDVDEENSDISNQIVAFKPAINITVL